MLGVDINDCLSVFAELVFHSRRPELEVSGVFVPNMFLHLLDLARREGIIDGFPKSSVSHIDVDLFLEVDLVLGSKRGTTA